MLKHHTHTHNVQKQLIIKYCVICDTICFDITAVKENKKNQNLDVDSGSEILVFSLSEMFSLNACLWFR